MLKLCGTYFVVWRKLFILNISISNEGILKILELTTHLKNLENQQKINEESRRKKIITEKSEINKLEKYNMRNQQVLIL